VSTGIGCRAAGGEAMPNSSVVAASSIGRGIRCHQRRADDT
jgi:hypothetical protein